MGLMRGIRRNVKAIYWVIVVTVVVSFIFWGTRMGLRGGGRRHVGSIFGRMVSYKGFYRQWRAAQQWAMEMELATGQEISPERVEDMAWRRIVELREADRWGVSVPMEEVRNRIRAMFSREGNFDENFYRAYLYRRGMTEEEFAFMTADNMKMGELERFVTRAVVVSPWEVREKYDYDKEQRKIKFHMVESAPLVAAFEVSDRGEHYYRAHTDEFREPKKVAVEYMMMETDAFLEKASVAEEELRKYYEDNKSSFKGTDGKTAQFEELKAQLERVLKSLKAELMAREQAEKVFAFSDASEMREVAQKNGLVLRKTGLIPEEGTVSDQLANEPDFRKAAFGTPVGALSGVIKTTKGYCVLSPSRIVEPRIPPLEEVRKAAAEKERAQQLRDAAERAGVSADQVETFVKEHSIVPADLDVTQEDAFRYYETRKSSEFKKPKKVKVQYLVVEKAPFQKDVKVTDREIKGEYEQNETNYKDQKGKVKPLAEVKGEIEKTLRESKANKMAEERANQALAVWRPQAMKQQAQKHALKLRESRLFARQETIDDYMGESPTFARHAFETDVGEVSPIFATDLGYCVLSPVQVVEEAVADFEEVAEKAADRAKNNKADDLAGDIAMELYRQVNEKTSGGKKDFETACKELGLKAEESGYFRRDDNTIEKVGVALGLASSILRDEPGRIGYPRRIQKGYIFYVVSEVKPPSDEDFAKDKDKYYDDLAEEKAQEAFREWLTALTKEANVKSSLRAAREAAAKKETQPRTEARKPPATRPPATGR